jgi:hypothetical protein
MMALAVWVVIGTKFRMFHVIRHPRFPTMKEAPPDPSFQIEEFRICWFDNPPWQACHIMEPYLSDALANLEFVAEGALDVQNKTGLPSRVCWIGRVA